MFSIVCLNVERMDAIKAIPIKINPNPVNPSFVKLKMSSFLICISCVLMDYFKVLLLCYHRILKTNTRRFSVSDSL